MKDLIVMADTSNKSYLSIYDVQQDKYYPFVGSQFLQYAEDLYHNLHTYAYYDVPVDIGHPICRLTDTGIEELGVNPRRATFEDLKRAVSEMQGRWS